MRRTDVLLVEVDNTADCENALKLDMEVLNLTLGATLIEALDDRLCGGDSFVHVYFNNREVFIFCFFELRHKPLFAFQDPNFPLQFFDLIGQFDNFLNKLILLIFMPLTQLNELLSHFFFRVDQMFQNQ